MSTRIIEPGQLEAPAGQIPFLRLADSGIFMVRAQRFRQLAGQASAAAWGGYLNMLAGLAEAQHHAYTNFPTAQLPTAEQQALCREHGMPVLGAQAWHREAIWRDGLQTMLHHLTALPDAAQAAVDGLRNIGFDKLEEQASHLLAGDLAAVDAAQMPFIAAALQVYWMHMAVSLGEAAIGRLEQGGLCPVCGSHPVAGIVRIGSVYQGLRYLCCSLCASEWHMVRVKCSNCESTGGISYFALEGSNGAVKAESCGACNTYLKLLYMEKDHQVDPVADDVATLALDMLMDEAGKARSGPNLLFHPG